jgi:hypothetical protein
MVSMSDELKERNILKSILIVRFACATLDVGHPITRLLDTLYGSQCAPAAKSSSHAKTVTMSPRYLRIPQRNTRCLKTKPQPTSVESPSNSTEYTIVSHLSDRRTINMMTSPPIKPSFAPAVCDETNHNLAEHRALNDVKWIRVLFIQHS